jgi:protein-tyrosine phosphatase
VDPSLSRALEFSATFNFRDVGGYPGLDGRTVRWRRLFRSDSLHRLGEPDREAFAALGVRTVIDLRRPREIDQTGRIPVEHAPTYRHIYPQHAEWDATTLAGRPEIERWLADRYVDMAREGIAAIGGALGVIADEEAAPVVVHCMAGKDRTGVVCAVTLSLVGVDDKDIAEDYALSEVASARLSQWLIDSDPAQVPLPSSFLAAPAGAMLYFLRDLREQYGSVEAYATAAGVAPEQIEAMRSHLLAE